MRRRRSSCLKAKAAGKATPVYVWRYDPTTDARPESAASDAVDGCRAVFLAARQRGADAIAWIAVDGYDDAEATVLFAAPPGDEHGAYVDATKPSLRQAPVFV